MIMLANAIKASARDHQAVAADWRNAARTAGIRRTPATTAAGDGTSNRRRQWPVSEPDRVIDLER
ncbi:hypothetical protein [Nonomuraea recticatena]